MIVVCVLEFSISTNGMLTRNILQQTDNHVDQQSLSV
jgi:hypothetical protein